MIINNDYLWRGRGKISGKSNEGGFLSLINVLFLELGMVTQVFSFCKNSLNCVVVACVLFGMYIVIFWYKNLSMKTCKQSNLAY
jgi:hypothetical protein